MNRRNHLFALCAWCCVLACCVFGVMALAQDAKPSASAPAASAPAASQPAVALPKPVTEGGKPLMEALKNRHSSREFDTSKKLSEQMLSNLLWAADGINRPDGKRTAPTASDKREIDVYVVTAEGAFLYEPKAHALVPVAKGDLRALTGSQAFVKDAPLNLVFVADLAKMGGGSAENKKNWAAADTGFVSQNVYLFCASEGLATVVRGMVDRGPLAKALGLRDDQWIVLAQTVGYPK